MIAFTTGWRNVMVTDKVTSVTADRREWGAFSLESFNLGRRNCSFIKCWFWLGSLDEMHKLPRTPVFVTGYLPWAGGEGSRRDC